MWISLRSLQITLVAILVIGCLVAWALLGPRDPISPLGSAFANEIRQASVVRTQEMKPLAVAPADALTAQDGQGNYGTGPAFEVSPARRDQLRDLLIGSKFATPAASLPPGVRCTQVFRFVTNGRRLDLMVDFTSKYLLLRPEGGEAQPFQFSDVTGDFQALSTAALDSRLGS